MFINKDMSVYPKSYLPKLKEMNYDIDVDSNKAKVSMEQFLDDLMKVLDKRIELYDYLWGKIDWDTFMLIFTGSDRLEHFLWDAYKNSDHQFHEDFL